MQVKKYERKIVKKGEELRTKNNFIKEKRKKRKKKEMKKEKLK